jgi:peptidoglycan/LPS O-acetylase OafA/YrhL
LYLWHVPVIMFRRFGIVQISHASNHVMNGATLVVSILVATLSWKFVETPFRTGRLMLKGRSAFAFAAVSAVILTVLGVTLLALHGLP